MILHAAPKTELKTSLSQVIYSTLQFHIYAILLLGFFGNNFPLYTQNCNISHEIYHKTYVAFISSKGSFTNYYISS